MRRRAVGAGLLVVAAVAIGCVAVAWWEDPPPVTAEEAADAVARALAGAGVPATVAPDPLASSYEPRGGQRTPVWQAFAAVEGGTIQVSVSQRGARPVFVDDRSPNGGQQLLSEAQFEAVTSGIDDPGRRRLVQRNVVLTTAAALVLAVATALSLHPHREPA
ncbi:MAG: hypothetical protein ACSLFP_00470 [Acidimicrobiales bacterium]